MASERSFIPAAGYDWLLPLYDPFQRLVGAEAVQRDLVALADVGPGMRVLEVGCGTGSVTLLLARLHPDAHVVGLDPDPKALERASRKAARAGVAIEFDQGFSDDLPYPDDSFDRVLSSFMFHHLDDAVQDATLAEARRVLRPGGSFHIADFAWAHGGKKSLVSRLVHGDDDMPHSQRDLESVLRGAFGEVSSHDERRTWLGRIARYSATA